MNGLRDLLDTISRVEWAALHDLSVSRAQQYCRQGRLPGARQEGRDYRIPRNAPKPQDTRKTRHSKAKKDAA